MILIKIIQDITNRLQMMRIPFMEFSFGNDYASNTRTSNKSTQKHKSTNNPQQIYCLSSSKPKRFKNNREQPTQRLREIHNQLGRKAHHYGSRHSSNSKSRNKTSSNLANQRLESEYFTRTSKRQSKKHKKLERQPTCWDFSRTIKKIDTSSQGSINSKKKYSPPPINLKLHKKRSSKYLKQIQDMMEREIGKQQLREEQMRQVEGILAVRLAKLHAIERKQANMQLQQLRMRFNLYQRELLR